MASKVHYIVRADSHKGWFKLHDTQDEAIEKGEEYIKQGYRKVIVYKAVATIVPRPQSEVYYHDD